MKHLCAALLLATVLWHGETACAKEACTHTWDKGEYKTFKQVEEELKERLGNAKILRLSLCGVANDHYFQVTILEASGKVVVLRLAARENRAIGGRDAPAGP
jgi:hypothetical protein